MSIAPILHSVEVRASPKRAFELFTSSMGRWWTRVTLEHRNLERFGTDAPEHATKFRNGWPTMVGHFVHYAESHC
jgi:hypothetical protein